MVGAIVAYTRLPAPTTHWSGLLVAPPRPRSPRTRAGTHRRCAPHTTVFLSCVLFTGKEDGDGDGDWHIAARDYLACMAKRRTTLLARVRCCHAMKEAWWTRGFIGFRGLESWVRVCSRLCLRATHRAWFIRLPGKRWISLRCVQGQRLCDLSGQGEKLSGEKLFEICQEMRDRPSIAWSAASLWIDSSKLPLRCTIWSGTIVSGEILVKLGNNSYFPDPCTMLYSSKPNCPPHRLCSHSLREHIHSPIQITNMLESRIISSLQPSNIGCHSRLSHIIHQIPWRLVQRLETNHCLRHPRKH
jgi:hypothetical protein